MPLYKTHLVGGFFTFCLINQANSIFSFFPQCSLPEHLLYLSLALTGSLFPDIDTQSKIQHIFWKILFISLPLCLLNNNFTLFACGSFVGIGLVQIPHRTITHRMSFLILFSLVITYLLANYHPGWRLQAYIGCLFFTSGAISHVLLDFGPWRAISRKF